jgi:hypothetical protein
MKTIQPKSHRHGALVDAILAARKNAGHRRIGKTAVRHILATFPGLTNAEFMAACETARDELLARFEATTTPSKH